MLSVDNLHLGSGNAQSLNGFVEYLPGETLPFATPAIQPFKGTFQRPKIEAPYRFQIARDVVIIVMPLQPAIQRHYKHAPFQMPILLYPFLDTPAGTLQLFACRSLFYFYSTAAVLHPVGFKPQKDDSPLHSRVEAAEAYHFGLFRRQCQVELGQPLG